jgi:hypothetical protein
MDGAGQKPADPMTTILAIPLGSAANVPGNPTCIAEAP